MLRRATVRAALRAAGRGAGGPCETVLCDVTGLIITVLQLGQVVPQHYEMWADQSSVGVSAYLLLFGSLYTYLAFLDTVFTDTVFLTCERGAYRCFLSLQPIVQMTGSALLTAGLWYWYLKFHRDPIEEAESFPNVDESFAEDAARLENSWTYDDTRTHSGWRFFWLYVVTSCLATLTILGTAYMHGAAGDVTQQIAEIYGLLSAALNAVMWLPQIATTYAFGHRGALSKWFVFFSVVMDIVYSVYLAFMGLHFSVWANNIPDGVQTAILLVLVIMYDIRDEAHHAYALPKSSSEGEAITVLMSPRPNSSLLNHPKHLND